MSFTKPQISIFLFALAAVLMAASYAFSFQSGCLFDGKQGYGYLAASEPYSAAALFSFFLGVGLLCSGLTVFKRWAAKQFIPALIVGLVVGVPVFGVLSFEASIHGTQQCNPS